MIVQEALTNVLRHAAAGAVTVDLHHARDAFTVTVTDDGTGGHPGGPGQTAPGGTGLGIQGMRRRAEALGGWLTAEPTPGAGFRVQALLPVRSAEREATMSGERETSGPVEREASGSP